MSDTDSHTLTASWIVFIALIVTEPYCIVALWRWFVVPLGVIPIGWSLALGLDFLRSCFFYRWHRERTREETFQALLGALVNCLFCLASGWIVMSFNR